MTSASALLRLSSVARRLLVELGSRIRHGRIEVRDGSAHFTLGALTPELAISVTLTVQRPRFWSRVLFGGSVGAGEAYVDGDWSSDDLVGLMRIFARNAEVLEELDRRYSRVTAPARRLLHTLRRNTPRGSRKNVQAHYDLGNDFYALFLDESMTYSCAVFERPGDTLESAQRKKLDRICKKLALGRDEHLLEIGCGWGSLACHAAERYGARVTAVTLSAEQYRFAVERVRERALGERVKILLADYRTLSGRFDKIASIEMIEAIGHQYYERFFAKLDALLAPGGSALLQTITLADHRFEAAKNDVDFIKRHVFPGGTIPSLAALSRAMTRSSALEIAHTEELGPDYALTLRAWRERFVARREQARSLGYDERFLRLWSYYLALCEGAFRERYLGDAQLVLKRAPSQERS